MSPKAKQVEWLRTQLTELWTFALRHGFDSAVLCAIEAALNSLDDERQES
jgi:hypothetical protein